jgi:hypothetical protein
MKYTQLVHFKGDEFDVATATTVEKAKELLQQASTTSLKETAKCS